MTSLRVSLVGGPGLSGKTTWLQHHRRDGAFKNAIACASESGGELALLKRLCNETNRQDTLRHVVMELDSLTEPASLREAIGADPDLVGLVNVGETLIVIDASLGAEQLSVDRRSRLQALAADAIILSKLDKGVGEPLKSLIATLRLLNPKAALFGAACGMEQDLPSDYGVHPEILPDLGGDGSGLPLTMAVIEIDDSVGWSALSLWLSALLHARGRDIMRIRVCVGAPSGGILLHGVAGELLAAEVTPAGATKQSGHVAVVGYGFRTEDLALSLGAFARAQH